MVGVHLRSTQGCEFRVPKIGTRSDCGPLAAHSSSLPETCDVCFLVASCASTLAGKSYCKRPRVASELGKHGRDDLGFVWGCYFGRGAGGCVEGERVLALSKWDRFCLGGCVRWGDLCFSIREQLSTSALRKLAWARSATPTFAWGDVWRGASTLRCARL